MTVQPDAENRCCRLSRFERKVEKFLCAPISTGMNTQCHCIPCELDVADVADESPLQPFSYVSLLTHAIIADLCALARKLNLKDRKRTACDRGTGGESL